MYKIGDTSGLCEAHCDEKKHTIKVVGDVIEKLAKKCEDVPKKMRAPSKVIEVTNGCFSSAQVIEVTDEGAADNGEGGACAGAAATGGGCGGGKTPKQPVCPGSSGCGKKSCCGGKQTKNKDSCSGQKLTSLNVPCTMRDFLDSDYSDLLSTEQDNETDFQQKFCARQPYPECATCPYNSKRFKTQERDLGAIFKQMDDAIQTMLKGNYSLANNMFACPGLLNSLMTADVRTMAEVAVPNAIAALVDVVAARGALEAFKGIATAAEYTDFRVAVMGAANKLLSAGGKVGIPRAFVSEVGKILEDIGCSPSTITRLLATSLGSRDTCYGPTYSPCGNKCCGRNRQDTTYKSSGRCCASAASAAKAEKALEKVKQSLDNAKEESTNPPASPKPATSSNTTYTPTQDEKAVEGKTYYKYVPETGATIPVAVKTGEPLDQVAARNDAVIFEIEQTGINKPTPTKTKDTVVTTGKTYLFNDPVTKQKVPIETQVGETIDSVIQRVSEEHGISDPTKVEIYERPGTSSPVVTSVRTTDTKVSPSKTYYNSNHVKVDVPSGTTISSEGTVEIGGVTIQLFEDVELQPNESYEKVDEKVPDPSKTYYVIDTNTGLYEFLDTSGGLPFTQDVFVKVTVPIGTDIGTAVYTGTDTCILDDGLVIEEPVFLDAASYVMAVDTQSLVTKTGTNAGEMASIEGIGLSAYEIKMGYLLDHLRNGSVLPDDVEGELVPTVLDTICDDN